MTGSHDDDAAHASSHGAPEPIESGQPGTAGQDRSRPTSWRRRRRGSSRARSRPSGSSSSAAASPGWSRRSSSRARATSRSSWRRSTGSAARVYTLRDFAPGLYAEAGAMRIPRVHDLTLAYCELFGLELRPFVMGNPKTLVHIDGQRMTNAEADRDPEPAAVRAGRAREGPDVQRALERGDARVPRALRGRGPGRAGGSCATTTSTPSASSWSRAASARAPSSCTA